MARGVRTNATLLPTLSPVLQPQSIAAYDPVTRRNTILVANIVPTLAFAGDRNEAIPADRYYALLGAAPASGQLPEWMSTTGSTQSYQNWDATDKRFYHQLNTNGKLSYDGQKVVYPVGPMGTATTHAPKNATAVAVLIQFRARFPANADYTVYGVGATSGSEFSTSTNHFIQVLRNAGSWELGTCDGSTISQSSGGTGDGSFHDFKVRWDTTDVRLYVDGTLTITKSTNNPAAPLGAFALNNTDDIDIVDYLVEWEVS